MRHRNSQRRPYCRHGFYFVTTNVSENFLALENRAFGFLLEHILHLSALVHDVDLIAYKLNPDHIHILVQIGEHGTISDYVGSFKRQFSRQVNENLKRLSNPGDDSNRHLVSLNRFRWQKSYHSHLVSSKLDFENHIKYIRKQHEHHQLPEDRHCFVDEKHRFEPG